MSKPSPLDFRALPVNDADLIPFYIGSDVSKPFWVTWRDLKRIIASTLPSGSGVLLKTNGATNPVQTLLNLVAGANMTITADGLGNITFTSSGGGAVDSVNGQIGVVILPLDDISNVNAPSPTIGQILQWNGTEWIAATISGTGTVTSVSPGAGMSFTTITGSGPVEIDTNKVPYIPAGFSVGFLKWSGVSWIFDSNTYLTLAAGDLLYYPLVGNPSGFLTSSALANYVQKTRQVATTGSLTGGGDLSADRTLQLVNDSVSPGNNKVYGTDASGTKGYKNDPSSVTGISLGITDLFEHTNATINSIEYVPSVNKIYVASGAGNVVIFNATTFQALATVTVTQALKVRYIASINEIWCTSVNTASIVRISPTTNASLGTITTGVVVNGYDILEYSALKVFICCANNPGTIMVVDPVTFIVTSITTSVPAFPTGLALNSNVLSAQFDKIIVTSSGVAILNPTTNAITTSIVNPSSALSQGREIYYSSVDDKYYIASQVNSRLVCLNIDSATTFSVNRIKENMFQTVSFQVDEANDLIIVNQTAASTLNLTTMCNFIRKSTFASIENYATPSLGGANTQSGPTKIDTVNKRVFIAGRASSRNIVTVKYQ